MRSPKFQCFLISGRIKEIRNNEIYSVQNIHPSFLTCQFINNTNRSSHRRCPVKKVVLRNFAKFTGKPLRPATLLNWKLWNRCFPVNFAKFLRTLFLIEHLRWLLLHQVKWIDNTIFLYLFLLNFTVIYLQLAVDTNQTKIVREIFNR